MVLALGTRLNLRTPNIEIQRAGKVIDSIFFTGSTLKCRNALAFGLSSPIRILDILVPDILVPLGILELLVPLFILDILVLSYILIGILDGLVQEELVQSQKLKDINLLMRLSGSPIPDWIIKMCEQLSTKSNVSNPRMV